MLNDHEVTTKTLIDNILINPNIQYQSGIIETSITDHYSIYIVVTDINKPNTVPNTIQFRLNNYKCQRKFNFYLIHYGIENILNNHKAKSAFIQFYDIFQKSYDKSFPIKSKIIKEKDIQKPWVTEYFINKIKKRDSLHKLLSKKKLARTEYTSYRNNLTSELKEAKTKYFESQFERNSSNMKKTWETINSVIKSKKVNSKTFLVDEDNNNIDEPDIPDKFIDHYSNIPFNLNTNIPPSQRNAASYLQNSINTTFTISPICPIEVDTIIDNLKDNGNKVNTISTSVLVESKHIITPILCHLINLFVYQGYFPEQLKLGCITPIFKSGDSKKVNNYRPVCSLSPLSKIIEKVINNRMVDFIEDQEIFSDSQFGFRKSMGTETALTHYIDHIQNELNKENYTISVFMDLSKAFDVICHNILKMKLQHYGFRGKFLEFLLNFIKDRQYFVNINGKNSKTKTVNMGVPQGSTLGPLLFLLYINDMSYASILLFLIQFADDSTITYSSDNLDKTIAEMQNEFKKVLDWLNANKLIINLSKTHLMLFTNRDRPETISLTVNNQTINEIKETKFLGVIVDNKLIWDTHINHISKKSSKSVSILKMLRYTFPKNVLKTLYYSLIYPYFNYCNLVWGSAAGMHLQTLIVLQKKAARIISKVGYLDHTEHLFKEHNMLTVPKIYDFNCAKFIFQCYNNKAYTLFRNKLKKTVIFIDMIQGIKTF